MPRMVRLVFDVRARMLRQGQDHARAIYQLSKALDAYRGEGTYNILASRTAMFYRPDWRQWFYEPIATFDQLVEVHTLNTRLADAGVPRGAGDFVQVGFRVYRSAFTAPGGLLPIPCEGDDWIGDHAVELIGVDEARDRLVFQNWWGREWGDDGVGYMSREYFDRYALEAWRSRSMAVGQTVSKAPLLRRAATEAELARVWMIPNPRWRQRVTRGRRRFEWVVYDAISVRNTFAEIIELKTAYGLRIAWAFVLHHCGADRRTSMVSEFFVWPAFRREGIGTLLEEGVVALAGKWDANRVEVLIHEADDLDSSGVPGKAFADSLGYAWQWVKETRPVVVARAVKTLQGGMA
jgi:GNAT superfamily N-acetyltransferase